MRSAKRITLRTLLYVVLAAQSLVVLFPLWLMFNSSLKASRQIFRNPFSLPDPVFWKNYLKLFVQQSYERYFLNSIGVTVVSLLLIVVVTSLAAYAIAKYRFKGNSQIFFYFLIGLMLPIRLGTINIMQMFITVNLYNNLLSLIAIYTAMGIPAGILIFTGFVREIPDELRDSARIDGYGETAIFLRIIVPLLTPAIVVVAVYNLIPIWNDFWFPLILINKDELMTVPLATARLFGKHETDYGLLFAILSAAAIPPIALFVTLSRYFIKGLTAGAIKG